MSPMRQLPLRPGFDHSVEASPDDVQGALQRALGETRLIGRMLSRHGLLALPDRSTDAFAPWLHLEVEVHRSEAAREGEPRRSYVRGFFTPHPSLWTFYVLAGIGLATLAMFSGIWGVIQLQLGKPATLLWLALVSSLGVLALYLVSRVGRSRAGGRMDELHERVSLILSEVGALEAGPGEEPAP